MYMYVFIRKQSVPPSTKSVSGVLVYIESLSMTGHISRTRTRVVGGGTTSDNIT